MPKFRKKPVVIDAVQFHVAMGVPPFYYDGNPVQFHKDCGSDGACSLDGKHFIQTLEGPFVVTDGDWIIKSVKGEFYPCKPDIFEATYEPAE